MVRRADRWQNAAEYKSVTDVGCAAGWAIAVSIAAIIIIAFAIAFASVTLDDVWIRFTLFELLNLIAGMLFLGMCFVRYFFTPFFVIIGSIVLVGIDVFVMTGRIVELQSVGITSCEWYCVLLFLTNALFIFGGLLYCCFGLRSLSYWGWSGDADFEDDYYGGSGESLVVNDDDNDIEPLLPTKVAIAYPAGKQSSHLWSKPDKNLLRR